MSKPNKHSKKKKKKSQLSSVGNGHVAEHRDPIPKSQKPIVEVNLQTKLARTKKAKKRKHSPNPPKNEESKCAGISEKKKKKSVTWGGTTSKVIPTDNGTSVDVESPQNNSLDPCTTTESFLALIARTDSTPDAPKQPWVSADILAKAAKRANKKARRLEKKAREKLAKVLKTNSEEKAGKALKSIADCNIRNRKLKEKLVDTEGNVEDAQKIDAKRPRLDAKTVVPSKTTRPPIPLNQEVVAGYKYSDLTEQQKEAFFKLKQQRKLDKNTSPKIQLLNCANYSSMVLDDDERTPLTLGDAQHFLFYSLYGHHSTGHLPTWVSLKNRQNVQKRVFIVVEGVSLSDYVKNENDLPGLRSFNYKMEIVTPYAYGGDFVTEFLHVPLTATQRHKLIKRRGSVKEACLAGEAFTTLQRIYPAGTFRRRKKIQEKSDEPKEPALPTFSDPNIVIAPPSADRFPRTELLLRSWDLIKERIPVPTAVGPLARKYADFVQTKDEYDEVTDESPIWALDCEMCQTRAGSELTRVSVINENFEVVYETLVKPYNPIINYLTQYSGITYKDLEHVWTRIEDVHADLRELLPSDVILAGHSVGCDLLALKMFHPYVIDTSTIFNLSGIRHMKTKLKTLMAELLMERIQEGGTHGHDSVEDAASCLKLIKAKLARSIEWGDAVLSGKRSEEESATSQRILLQRDAENRPPTIYPVAAKSIIRSGPRAHQTVHRPLEQMIEKRRPVPQKPIRSRPKPDPKYTSVFCKPIFDHLVKRCEKRLLFVGDENFVSAGRELVGSKFKVDLPESRLKFSVQTNSDAVTYSCENAPLDGTSLLRLSTSEAESDPDARVKQIDNLIGSALDKLKPYTSLVTILLTGRNSDQSDVTDLYTNHGLLMMKILKPRHVPLTIDDLTSTCS